MSRHEGEPEEESLDEDHSDNDDDDDDDSEGMAARLDRALQGLPQTAVPSSCVGASKGPQGEPHDGGQKEASPRRPCSDTPPAPAQGRAVPPPQPLPASSPGRKVKTSTTGPLTRGRAAAVASSQGEGHRRSAGPNVRQPGRVEPRPAPVVEKPGATTHGSFRLAGRGTGRRVILPVG